MENPVLVEITRGAQIESVHRGAMAIANAEGEILFSLGDIDTPTFPRSSLKMVQALPLLESGAADAFGLNDEEIALACASHTSEPMHIERVTAWLKRIDCSEADLACGTHPSLSENVNDAMIAHGEKPTPIANNCSGKHTGFLTVCRHCNIATKGYELRSHPLQIAVAKALGELSEIDGDIPYGIDGCVAPAFAVSPRAMARVLAKYADPSGQPPKRAAAMRRIVTAMIARPDLVAGTGRSDTIFMRAANNRIATKVGAEGFYAAIIPEAGFGVALKIEDGAGRAVETAMAAVLDKLGVLTHNKDVDQIIRAPISNTRGAVVGERRPAPALATAPIRALIDSLQH